MPQNSHSKSQLYAQNPILKLTFEFALATIVYSELLEKNGKHVIARQLLRSGTGIGSNVKEAQNAESKADFVHKMKIALKEADETEYWLALCNNAASYPTNPELEKLLTPIQKMLNKIVSTSKRIG